MGAVHDEYLRYMQWLAAKEEPADAKRIARIVQDNLDALIPTVNNGGQRATVLTPMLRRDLDNTPDLIESAQADVAAAQLPWTRLKKLTIGPFRGFRREEEFDLSHNIVLFQGPNGSGKTPEAALAWKYLNKGTHDGDGEDFEIGIVQQILSALPKLSASFGA